MRQILITTPGKHPNITSAQYFAEPCPSPAFTNSLCKTLINETPMDAAYLHPAIGAPPEEVESTVAKRRGDVVHQLALGKGRGYAVGEYDAWRSNEAKEFKRLSEDSGLTPIKRADFDEAQIMASTVKHLIERTLTNIGLERGIEVPPGGFPYETEVVFACKFTIDGVDIWARIMVDVWCESLLVALDPKTTPFLTDKRAPAHIQNMGWDTQAAFYKRVIETVYPEHSGRILFIDLMVKPKPPFTYRAVAIPESWLTTANMEIDHAMGVFARCIKADDWPGYAPVVHYMQQPSWAQKLALEREMEMADE